MIKLGSDMPALKDITLKYNGHFEPTTFQQQQALGR